MPSGSFELKADGSCEASGDIVIGGISFLEHVHKLPALQDGQGLPVAATLPDKLETKTPQ